VVSIIKGYQKSLAELGLDPHAVTRAVATNILSEATKVAQMAQAGLARVIRPVHSPLDGDVVLSVIRKHLPPTPVRLSSETPDPAFMAKHSW